ncbi:MAG: TIGR03936 family radical SAM-associated protein, partial [Candidatus Marinimicrobia bacterium]|nr:TIGR03936 family radical SAM-associated protein [Candidatus Neomarinimicrobiota bacterium]
DDRCKLRLSAARRRVGGHPGVGYRAEGLRPLIPLTEITQDRFAMEIQRGCGAGCRFCHAGITYLPVRERDAADLIRQVEETLNNSGYEELSLLSLSTSDYSALDELVRGIEPLNRDNKVGISFPSLRLDSFNVRILEAAGTRRRSGLTFAPEAGTQRLRNAINKKISEEDLFSSVKLALEHGWRTLKFYFMVGLPTENDEDLQGIVDLIREVQHMAAAYPGTRINVSLSSFIPKAHTPFQWEAHIPPAELSRRINLIRELLRLKNVNLHYRDPKFSVYESLFSRGGRNTAAILYSAWAAGARFDAWPEIFNPEIWDRAIRESGIDVASEIAARPVNKALPWSFIDSGVNEAYLLKEREKAERGEITEDCRTHCSACGLCDGTLKMRLAKKHAEKSVTVKQQPAATEEQGQEYYTLRMFFEKRGMLRYVGHHDLMRLMLRVCNMLKWPLRYSSGFTKHPRIALGYPIPMGFDGMREAMDILLNGKVESPAEALNALLPEGLRILHAEMRKGKQPSLMQSTRELCYRFHFDEALDVAGIRERIEKALAADRVIMERKSGKRPGAVDLKPFIRYWSAGEQSLEVCYKVIDSRTGRPDEFLQLAFDKKIPFYTGERKYVTIKE